MSDLQFESRLARQLNAIAEDGVRPVDAHAIAQAMVTERGRRMLVPWRAPRSMVPVLLILLLLALLSAAIIVGSRLVAEQNDLLSRLHTDEPEPGVLRVIDDGVRDPSRPVTGTGYDLSYYYSNIVAGQDGSVWVFSEDDYYRLADAATHPTDQATPNFNEYKAEVGPDGTLWAMQRAGRNQTSAGSLHVLRSFDGRAWTVRQEGVRGWDMEPDGTVWVDGARGLTRLVGDTWTVASPEGGFGEERSDETGRFFVLPTIDEGLVAEMRADTGGSWAGEPVVMLLELGYSAQDHSRTLVLDGDPGRVSWPGGQLDTQSAMWGDTPVDVGDRGDYWLHRSVASSASVTDEPAPQLIHVEGRVTTVHTQGIAGFGGIPELGGILRASPDGSVWHSLACDGLAHFDGRSVARYLAGRCVSGLDVGPDGTAWVLAVRPPLDGDPVQRWGPVELFVIRSEATSADA